MAEERADADGEAHSLKMICAENGDGLEDSLSGKAGGIDDRVGDGEDFTGEGGVRGDELAELVELDILVVG
jgi:hypothetical protein